MTTILVYDPPMCCSTGICGTDVDQQLIDLAADLDWLKGQGVSVRRINLSQEPGEFIANPVISEILQSSEGDDLPAIMVDGALMSKARYPSRSELAGWAGIGTSAAEPTGQVQVLIPEAKATSSGCCGGAKAEPAPEKAAGGCCSGAKTVTAPATQKSGACC